MAIKLKKSNERRYCPECKEVVKLRMEGLVGRCPNQNCGKVLYIIDISNKSR